MDGGGGAGDGKVTGRSDGANGTANLLSTPLSLTKCYGGIRYAL